MSDGTRLNLGTTGDLIVTEELAVGSSGRATSSLPSSVYKMPRSKIAIGAMGTDQGDATDDAPLPTGDRAVRRMLELQQIQAEEASYDSLRSRASCRTYHRGNRGRGTR